MAQPERIKIPRAPDRSVVDFFKALGTQYGVEDANIGAHASAQIGVVKIKEDPTGDLALLLDLDSELILTMQLRIAGLTIAYYRGGYPAPPPEVRSPIYDEIALTFNAQQGDVTNEDKLKIVALINKRLRVFQSDRPAVTGLSKEQGDLIAIHNSTLERLENLGEDLIRQTSEYRVELDKKVAEKSENIEADYTAKKEKLDADFSRKKDALDAEKSLLEAREKRIDDRDNTHARRELRLELLNEIQARSDKFALTRGTQRLRWPIHAACVVFFGISAWFAYTYSSELFQYVQGDNVATVSTVLLSLKSLGFTFAAVATGIFYIRWLNHWFNQHADAEFRVKQFQLDVDRASWIVETVLEMKAGKDVIPTALLNALTTNLFEYDSRRDETPHPADELASALLGSASNVKVKAGDAEIDFTGKSLKKGMKKKDPSN